MSFSSRRGGFALPTVLISSIIMLMVLLSAASSTSAVRTSLKTQYYNQLSGEAADAGVVYAKACIANEPTKTPGWTNDKPLKVNTDCKGDVVTACTDGSIDSKCSVVVTDDNRIIATFSVPVPPKDSDNKYTEISATGRVVLLRSNDSSVWREFKQTTSSSLYSKLTASLPPIGTTLANCNWKEIKLIAEAGLGDDYFNVGDTKDLTLTTGETLTMQIYDFNHDDKSDGSGKANITFGLMNRMSAVASVNPTSRTNVGGWNGSEIRTWTNNTLLNQLPPTIQSSIKSVNKLTTEGNNSNIIITSSDKVFLLSEVEIQGNSVTYGISAPTSSRPGEGSQYQLFLNNNANKSRGGDYWTRSSTNSSGVNFVYISGINSFNDYVYYTSGVVFGFAIGNAPKYSIVFNSQGGSAITSQSLEIGKEITEPSAPTKSGSVFAGWYKEASYTNAWNFSTDTVTANTTLYAKWIEMPAIGTPLESFSWEQIAYISEHGQADTYFDIGNTKNITLSTSEVLTMQIYDFNHDDKSDSSGKAGITFGTKDLMAAKRQMNDSGTNGSWNLSLMRSWTNGELYNSLPSTLKATVKSVNKKTSLGTGLPDISITSDKIFLFSEVETFGNNPFSNSGEGYKYPIFSNDNSRIKKLMNGADIPSGWWERSPSSSNGAFYIKIDNAGYASGYDYPYSQIGIAFGFAI